MAPEVTKAVVETAKGMNELIITFITGVLAPVIIMIVKHILDKRKEAKDEAKVDKVTEAAKEANVVNKILQEIKREYHTDRAYVSIFHNGGHYPSGKSIQKFSIFHELVSAKGTTVQSKFQNIPVSLFSVSIEEISDKGMICIPDASDDDQFGLRHFMQQGNIQSGYFFALRDIDDQFIGVLGVEFVNSTWLDHKHLEDINNTASRLGMALNSNIK